jgi:hypothetical protein
LFFTQGVLALQAEPGGIARTVSPDAEEQRAVLHTNGLDKDVVVLPKRLAEFDGTLWVSVGLSSITSSYEPTTGNSHARDVLLPTYSVTTTKSLPDHATAATPR